MKANKAPENIYRTTTYLDNDKSKTVWKNAPVAGAENIKYTRTDAIIEKALKFLDGRIPDYIELKHTNVDTFMYVDNKRFIEDFKNYMKGE